MRKSTVLSPASPSSETQKSKHGSRGKKRAGARNQPEGDGLSTTIHASKPESWAKTQVAKELYLTGRAHFLCDEALEAAIREAVRD
jgi:hypothetical protein